MRVRLNRERLAKMLAESRLSQNHWALKMELSRGHWSDIVNGKHLYPSAKTRQRMLEVFQLPLEELFTIEAAPTPTEIGFRAAIAGRYLIDRELGQGSMGSVYLARDIARGRMVAVKAISPEAASGVGVPAIEREISTVAQLHHPNIIPLYDSGCVAEHPFFVMPWVRDGSLRQRIRDHGALDPLICVAIIRGVAAALDYAHSERVLHCDVKPENVLLHGDHAYLTDFGISRALHDEYSSYRAPGVLDTSAGTPAYVSPEQASGSGAISARSDVYSLGCVAFEMLVGLPPFDGTTTTDVVAKRFRISVPRADRANARVPSALATAIERAMALEPNERFASAGAFAEACAAALAYPISATPLRSLVATLAHRLSSPGRPPRMHSVFQDLRLAARSLARSPRFVIAMVLPLALGLGAGTTFFNIVDNLMFRPPTGVREPDRVVRIVTDTRRKDGTTLTMPSHAWVDYEALQRARVFEHVAATITLAVSIGRGEGATLSPVSLVTPSFFPLLGVLPYRGRFFAESEDVAGASPMPCVLSFDKWQTAFGGSPEALGTTFAFGGLQCQVVGIAPPGFRGIDLGAVDVFAPLRTAGVDFQGNAPDVWSTDHSSWIRLIGRIPRGTSPAAVSEAATRAYRSFAPRTRDPKLEGVIRVEPVKAARGSNRSTSARLALLLFGAAGILLFLVIANSLNLFIARNLSRAKENAVRAALGGGRLRLFRVQAAEALLLALSAALCALIVVRWSGMSARALLFPGSSWSSTSTDARTALFVFALALAIGIIVAVVAAWQANIRDVAAQLRSTVRLRSRGGAILRAWLVGLQAAVSLALLIASVAFIRSFVAASRVDLGMNLTNVLSVTIRGSADDNPTAKRQLYLNLRDQVAALPGVAAATLGYTSPFNNNRFEDVSEPGRDSLPPAPIFGAPLFDVATPEYQKVFGVTMRAGRWISSADVAGAPPVLVVNEALANLYWPSASPLGRCLRIGPADSPCRTIVGLVKDLRVTGTLDQPTLPIYYLPVAQAGDYRWGPTLFVQTNGTLAATELVRRTAQTLLPNLPAVDVHRLSEQFDPLVAPHRLGAAAFTTLGAVAVIVALAGLYGILSVLVTERQHEFAIRAAIGGNATQIARPVAQHTGAIVLGGSLAGIVAIWLASPYLGKLLFHVSLLDPLALVSAAFALLLAAALSAIAPARRAARQDPMQVLRSG